MQLIARISISFAKIFEYINHARPNLTYIKSILYLIEISCKHNLQCIAESLEIRQWETLPPAKQPLNPYPIQRIHFHRIKHFPLSLSLSLSTFP